MVEDAVQGSVRCVPFRKTGGRISVVIIVESVKQGGAVIVEECFARRSFAGPGK